MWRMTVTQNEIIIAERSYYSAHECTVSMDKARQHYEAKGEAVTIEMKDKNKALIATLKVNPLTLLQ